MMTNPLILFDGICNLCNGTVNFVIDRDPEMRFRFAALQSETAQKILAGHNLSGENMETIILIVGDNAYTKSTAVLKIAKRLHLPWSLLSLFFIIPPVIRDVVYDFIAGNRYHWFGKLDSCRVPTPELEGRFIS